MNESSSEGGKAKEKYNRFGLWVNALNTLLGTNITEMASRIGVGKSTLSTAMRGERGMLPANLVALKNAYQVLADERGMPLPASWDSHFGLSWYDSPDLSGMGDQTLASLQHRATQIERTTKLVVSMMREIEQLRKENERLIRENATLKRNGSDTKKRF